MTSLRACLAVATMALLAACTPAGPPAATVEPTSATSTAPPPTTSTLSSGEAPRNVDLEWRSVLTLGYPTSEVDILDHTDKAMIVQTITADDDVTLTYTPTTGAPSALVRDSGHYVQDAWVLSDGVLILGAIDGGWEAPYQLELWTPGQRTAHVLSTVRGLETLSEAAVADDTLYFIVDGLQGSCLFRATFEGDDLERHRLTCSTPEETGLWWLQSAGPTISWIASSKDRVAPTNGEFTCSTLYRLAHGSDAPEAVPWADCVSRGAASSTMAAWSTAPVVDPEANSSSWDEAAMYVAGSGAPVAVGLGSAGSEVICGDVALWDSEVPSSIPGAPATHHRAWMPALGAVQLSQPPATNVETDNLVKAHCIDAMTIGTEKLNNTDRVMEYFVADISALRDPP